MRKNSIRPVVILRVVLLSVLVLHGGFFERGDFYVCTKPAVGGCHPSCRAGRNLQPVTRWDTLDCIF